MKTETDREIRKDEVGFYRLLGKCKCLTLSHARVIRLRKPSFVWTFKWDPYHHRSILWSNLLHRSIILSTCVFAILNGQMKWTVDWAPKVWTAYNNLSQCAELCGAGHYQVYAFLWSSRSNNEKCIWSLIDNSNS